MEDWDTALAGFRRTFLDRVPLLAREATAALDILRKDSTSIEALSSLHLVLHKIAGSGGTYGFATMATAATDGETVCRRLLDAGEAPSAADLSEWDLCIERVVASAAVAHSELPAGAAAGSHSEAETSNRLN